MKHTYQLPEIPPSMAAIMAKRGYNACQLSLYSTKPSGVLQRVVEEAKRAYLHPDSLVDLVVYGERINAPRVNAQGHFIEGSPTLVIDDAPRPIQGSYLRILCPIVANVGATSEVSEASAHASAENCATLIWLMHGEFVALERHYSALIFINPSKTQVTGGGRPIRQTMDGEPLNQKLAQIFDEQGESDLLQNSTAMSLLHRAHHETDDTNKFLFMWLALEIIIGSGQQRKKFALETMGSQLLNDVINELRVTRDALVHDGAFVQLTHRIFLKLKCVILMRMAGNEVTRHRLLEYLMNELSVDR